MIKFQCGQCGKKIGVPEEFGGKRVRCPRCREAALVPEGEPALEAVEEAGLEMEPEASRMEEGGISLDFFEGFSGDAAAEAVETDGAAGMLRCMDCGAEIHPDSEFCVQCGREAPRPPEPVIEEAGEAEGGRSKGWGQRDPAEVREVTVAGRLPFALAGGLAAAAVGAVVWGALAYYTSFEFGIVAWGIGGLVGLGVALMARQEHAIFGVLAMCLALGGIAAGKVLAVNWSVDKELTGLFESKGFQGVSFALARNDHFMFFLGGLQLYEEEAIAEDDIGYVMTYYRRTVGEDEMEESLRNTAELIMETAASPEAKMMGEGMLQGMAAAESEEELELPEDRLGDFERDMQRIIERRDGWGQEEREAVVTEFFTGFTRRMVDSMTAMDKLRASIGLFDVIFAFLALGTAYKVGEG